MSLAFDGDRLVGYASWVRGTGYRSDAVLDVPDLFAATDDAARTLIAVLQVAQRHLRPSGCVRSPSTLPAADPVGDRHSVRCPAVDAPAGRRGACRQ